jgi:hypothetical protein
MKVERPAKTPVFVCFFGEETVRSVALNSSLRTLAGCGKTGVCSEIFFCIRIWFWTETVGSEVYLVDKGFLFGF